MNTTVREKLDALAGSGAQWEADVLAYLRDRSAPVDKDFRKALLELLAAFDKAVMSGDMDLDAVAGCFSDGDTRATVMKTMRNRLRPYFACAFIRRSWPDCRGYLETLIDLLWRKTIIRRDLGYSDEEFDWERLSITEEELNEFAATLDAVTYHCISRLATHDAVVGVITEQMGVDKEVGEYIARKIDRDEDALRINYIIRNLKK